MNAVTRLAWNSLPDVDIWRVDLDAYARDRACAPFSNEECVRAARMLPNVARRFLAARDAMRSVLGRVLGLTSTDIAIDVDESGKPALRDSKLHFNVTHSGAMCLIATSRRLPIGIDVECLRPVAETASLAKAHFTREEQDEWNRARSDAKFLRCWTRKEACLKALGVGLQVEPALVNAGCADSSRLVEVPIRGRICRVVVHTLPFADDAVSAVALADA